MLFNTRIFWFFLAAVLSCYWALPHRAQNRMLLLDRGSVPALLVIGFADEQLSDRAPVHVDRLAGYYGGLRIAPGLFREYVRDFSSRVDFLFSSVSALYANRDRVRDELLKTFVPRYKPYAQQANVSLKTAAGRSAAPGYHRFERLLAVCKAHSIPVAVVAMPIPYTYRVDLEVPVLTVKYGGGFFDVTHVAELRELRHPDGYHLDAEGAQVYSHTFGAALANSRSIALSRQGVQ
jgi:hypothetical protein